MFTRQAKHVKKALHRKSKLWMRLEVALAGMGVVVLAVTGVNMAPVAAPAPAPTPISYAIPEALKAPVEKAPALKKAGAVAPIKTAARPTASVAWNSTHGLSWKQARIYQKAISMVGWRQDCVVAVARAIQYADGRWIQRWPWQYYWYGYPVSYTNAKAGDLVYYANGGTGWAHIAVYAGNGQAVHGGWNGWTTVKTTVWLGSGPRFIRLR